MFWDILNSTLPKLLTGLQLTVVITLASFVLGQILALPLALAVRAKSKLLSWPARTYIFLIRGSPMLVQIFLIYYGLGSLPEVRGSFLWPILRDPVNCAILAIGLNSAAYMGALIAGALADVPKGLDEAARMLGIGRLRRLIHVTLPMVYRQILPVSGNEMTLVLKGSSLASTITVLEMTGVARKAVAQTFAPFEVFAIAGVVYLMVGLVAAWGFARLEKWLQIPGLGAAKP